MADWDDLGRVWTRLQRVEDELKGSANPGTAQYDSMGRPASSASHVSSNWALEQLGRVGRVRRALNDSGPLAERLIIDALSGLSLSMIWPILLAACKDIAIYYGGSVAAGGALGFAGGAFFGGVGAIPGAAAGAAAGSYVGGVVLAMLGLKSMLEGAAQAISECFGFYRSGFVEAWGPVRQDQQHGFDSTSAGNPTFAATDFAQGHVILITAILAGMVAYLTKGKGDKAALLNEISRSPRLGPRVARWVAENEAKLKQHPALQSRKRSAGHSEDPPRRKRDSDDDGPPKGMPKKEVPCFNTNDLPADKIPEFDRQLAGQEKGLRNMTVDEYLTGRKAFTDGLSLRDPKIARAARKKYETELKNELNKQMRAAGMSRNEAKAAAAIQAAEKMKTLAALHNPDMIAAGKDIISDFGDRNVNSRLGAQWNKGDRLAELDRAAKAVPASIRGTNMNVKLQRCK